MKTTLITTIIAILCFTSIAKPLASFKDQLTDKIPGWNFKPSKPKNGMTYNKFEGYYPDKGGKLISARIKLNKQPGKGAYYRITFEAQAPERAYQGIDFYDAKGKLLPDCYDVIYPGKKRSYDRIIYAMPDVASFDVFFQSKTGIQAWNLNIKEATVEDAAAYCDRVYAELPPVHVTAPKDFMKALPRTTKALKTGKPWHIVLLGDSIMQDTFHSQFHALLKREFPKSNCQFTISMRGGTGCWHYQYADNFNEYVFSKKPDLLIIGGISNDKPSGKNRNGVNAMESVVKAAKSMLGCEVLILSPTLAVDTRQYDPENLNKPLPKQPWNWHQHEMCQGKFTACRYKHMARRNKIPYADMMTPAYTWLYNSAKPRHFYSRDAVHSGEKGKQIIGRTLMEYLKTAKQ